MADRPILFSGAMVRAIQSGRKTQTRRVVKPKRGWPIDFVGGGPKGGPDWNDPSCWGFEDHNTATWWLLKSDGDDAQQIPCPYGQAGDRLWVRETWKPRIVHSCYDMACDCETVWVDYPAGGDGKHFYGDDIPDEWLMPQAAIKGRPVPSLHMPRWASRILLEITNVRVERLKDCSEADAIAEGIEPFTDFQSSGHWKRYRDGGCTSYVDNPIASYASLWTEINGAGAWEKNPWVWVVEFRRVM